MLLSGVAAAAAIVAVLFLRRAWLRRTPDGPLGLRRSRLEHGLARVRALGDSFDSLLSGNRALREAHKSARKAFAEHGLQVRDATVLSVWRHLPIMREHEARYYGRVAAFPVAVVRYLAFWMTLCDGQRFEEVYSADGQLVAISMSIAKGQTLRGMWFYQRTSASRCYIWHYTMLLAVRRVFQFPQLQYVDVGPSAVSLRGPKERLGFAFVKPEEWMPLYQGPYIALSPAEALF